MLELSLLTESSSGPSSAPFSSVLLRLLLGYHIEGEGTLQPTKLLGSNLTYMPQYFLVPVLDRRSRMLLYDKEVDTSQAFGKHQRSGLSLTPMSGSSVGAADEASRLIWPPTQIPDNCRVVWHEDVTPVPRPRSGYVTLFAHTCSANDDVAIFTVFDAMNLSGCRQAA